MRMRPLAMLRRLAWRASDLPEGVARCCLALVALASGFGCWQLGEWYGHATEPQPGADHERASAVVVSERTTEYRGARPVSSPGATATIYTVRFTDASGRRVDAESRCNEGVSLDTGDHIEVFFERADPKNVCIAGAQDEDRLPILLVVASAVAFVGIAGLAMIAGWFAVVPWR